MWLSVLCCCLYVYLAVSSTQANWLKTWMLSDTTYLGFRPLLLYFLPQLPDFRTTNTFMSCRHWLTSSNTSGHGFKSWTSLNFFQALIFTTGSVVFITARITFIFLYVELVIKKTCCYTLCPSVVNLTALIFLAKLRVVTWSIKKQTQDDNGTEKLKLLLSRDDSSTGKRVLVICDCWIQKINMVLFQTSCIISGKK